MANFSGDDKMAKSGKRHVSDRISILMSQFNVNFSYTMLFSFEHSRRAFHRNGCVATIYLIGSLLIVEDLSTKPTAYFIVFH